MKNITTRQFSILADCGRIYQFLLEIYERDWRNGVPAPFFEYAYASHASWMDITYSYKNRIWEDRGTIAAFCFYENPPSDIYFCLRPGYEELAGEMIAYADKVMPNQGGNIQLILFGEQGALMAAAEKAGYVQAGECVEMQFDFEKELVYPLPDGFRLIPPQEIEFSKVGECCWKGFDHEQTEGEWNQQDVRNQYQLLTAPHATPKLGVAIADETGAYACYAGMWWTPENRLAYLEPLCTIPKYRRRGLAAAALSELYRRTKALGATHMTGGFDAFYEKIGGQPAVRWTFWKKNLS